MRHLPVSLVGYAAGAANPPYKSSVHACTCTAAGSRRLVRRSKAR